MQRGEEIRYNRAMSLLNADVALTKLDQFFLKESPVHKTLRDLAHRLPEAGIAYAVIGGMALNLYGYERATVDVDLLMTKEGLARFEQSFVGLGYLPAYEGARKQFKNTETGVQIEIITTGEYPGDGKPKAIAFPDPELVSEEASGIRVVKLATLIELKLASGLSAPHRLKDLADVQQLIERLSLPANLAGDLNASVRDEYLRLWRITDEARSEK